MEQSTAASAAAPLDVALELVQTGTRRFTVTTSAVFWNIAGPFGGWVFAAAAKAILSDPELQGVPIEAHARFLAAPKAGQVEILVTRLSQGKSVAFWKAELMQQQGDRLRLCAEVSMLLASERETIDVVTAPRPVVPDPERIRPINSAKGPLRWLDLYDVRYVSGKPFTDIGQSTMASVMWVREKTPRALDWIGLIALADIVAPRTFLLQPGIVPTSTVSMAVYFTASQKELQEPGSDWLLFDIDGHAARRGFFDHRVAIWRGDRLLATSTQLAWFS